MKIPRLFAVLFTACLSTAAFAQLAPANEAGVTMGQVSLNVKNVEENIKFWTMLGGQPIKIDGVNVMKFPGIYVFLVPGNPPPLGKRLTKEFCACPADGYETSTINHIGFNVQDYKGFWEKFHAAGAHMEDLHNAPERTLLFSPDGVMLEIASSKTLVGTIGEMHVHTFVSDIPPVNRDHQIVPFEMYLWYAKMFGVKLMQGPPGIGLGDDLPGGRLRISQTRLPIVPTKGRAIDHIGFEVHDLKAFCKRLEDSGVKLDGPYSTTRHKSFASAELTDAWGTSIELTEGLYKF